MGFERISPARAKEIIDAGGATVIDIRDAQSFAQAHIPGARHVDGSTVAAVLESADPAAALVVYCYHGNSSQGAAAYFAERGFSRAYSMDGGFESWRMLYPA